MVFNNRTFISNKNRNTNLFNRTIIGAITLLLLVSGIYSALLLLNNASAASESVFTSIPSPLPSNSPSIGFQAESTAEIGDRVTLGGTNRNLETATVTLSSWACESGSWNTTCTTTPGATFTHPITLNIYEAGTGDQAGTLIKSVTQSFAIPYRPSSEPTCANPATWKDSSGNCFNGMNHNVTFDLDGVTVPDNIVYGVSYNTQSYGPVPTGVDGPYNSLNVSLNTDAAAPYVGTDVESDSVFQNTSPAFGGDNTFKLLPGWSPYKLAVAFSAEEPPAPVPPTITNLKVTNPNWGDGYNILNIPNHQSTVSGRPTVGGNLKVSADFADETILTNVISYLPGRGFFGQSEYTPEPVNNGTWQQVPNGNYSVAWDTKNGVDWRAVPDGDYTFMFEARDADQGQNQPQNSTTVPVNLTVDNTAPGVAFTGTTPADGATVSGTINVQGDFTDVNGLMNTDIGIHAIAWYCHTDWPAVGTKSCSIDTTTLPDGPQQITMNGRDKAGNTFQVFRSITVNNDPPVITGTTFTEEPSGQSVLTNGFTDSQNFVFNLSSTGDATRYQLKYWNDITGSPYKEASPWNPSDLAGYSTSLGVYHDNFTQGNGKHYFSFSACDGMGNCSDYGTPFVVTFDNVDPSVPVHVSPADGTVTTTANQTSINWDDSTDANAVTYVYQSSLSSAVNADGSFVAPAYTSGALSSSEIPTPGTPAGTYYWHVKAVDTAGNESAWSSSWVIVVDNTAPVVTLDTIPDSDDTTPTLTGTVDDPDAVITVSIDGGTPANATNNGDGTWTYTVDPALTTGDYTVTVAATDSAGNGTTPAPTDDFTVTEPVVVVTQTQGGDGAGGGTGTDGGTGGGGGGAGAPAAFFAGFIAGGAGDGDGAGDGAPADQAVAGDTNNANDTNGNVRAGDNAGVAAATTDQSGWRFNWWWLLILAALAVAFYGWYRYRQAQADKTL